MKQVVAALIVREDEVLICQRTRHQPLPLKWEFPGGKIERGEQPHDALRRELDEELGIDATVGDEVFRLKHHYANGLGIELRFFLVREFKRELENRIFQQIVWAHRAELPRYDFLEADLKLVEQIAAGKVY
jgi:8-oxo-dGTP diphosphatase